MGRHAGAWRPSCGPGRECCSATRTVSRARRRFYVFLLPLLHFWQSWLLWALVLTGAVCLAIYGLAISGTGIEPAALPQFLLHRARGTHAPPAAPGAAGAGRRGRLAGDLRLPGGAPRADGGGQLHRPPRPPARHLHPASERGPGGAALPGRRGDSYAGRAAGAFLVAVVLLLGRGPSRPWCSACRWSRPRSARSALHPGEHPRTARAYGLDRIVEQNFPAEEAVRLEAIKENSTSLVNIRLWDYRPLRQLQPAAVDPLLLRLRRRGRRPPPVDWDYRQVMLSARELVPERPAPRPRPGSTAPCSTPTATA